MRTQAFLRSTARWLALLSFSGLAACGGGGGGGGDATGGDGTSYRVSYVPGQLTSRWLDTANFLDPLTVRATFNPAPTGTIYPRNGS